jgi:Domain of unknown function (DUF1877)
MSMIGKLRQLSEFELAKFRKNPGEMVRSLAGSPAFVADPQVYMQLRETLQQSPVVQQMMELSQQGKAPTREQQAELQQQMMQLMKQAAELRKAAMGKADSLPQPGPPADLKELDLHKSWHCLHYLFTGKVEGSDGSALGEAILGGTEIGGEAADTGYGPPRALSPAQVKKVAEALDAFPIEQKAKAYDAAAADEAGIYVAQHDPQELQHYFAELRDFYDDAARNGNAVLLWIS